MSSTRILLGVITGAHGIQGAVKIKSFTEESQAIAAYGPLQDKSGKRAFSITILGEAKGQIIARLEGVRDRNQAESLRGVELYVQRNVLPELDDNAFLIEDLIGMAAYAEDGSLCGQISAFHNYGAGDILEITFDDGKSEMFSFTDANFPQIDVGARRVTFCPPEILTTGKTTEARASTREE
ncbi:MAG: ribosome maturation factor RimM [Rickettsiales bacterium]|nr:ribosome maturation factor RimM [Rickettsiales bacterium]